jgi:hypothetical protein
MVSSRFAFISLLSFALVSLVLAVPSPEITIAARAGVVEERNREFSFLLESNSQIDSAVS